MERECEGQQKGLLQAHWQQKEEKGKCGPAAELGDCPGDKSQGKDQDTQDLLHLGVYQKKSPSTSPKLLWLVAEFEGEGDTTHSRAQSKSTESNWPSTSPLDQMACI